MRLDGSTAIAGGDGGRPTSGVHSPLSWTRQGGAGSTDSPKTCALNVCGLFGLFVLVVDARLGVGIFLCVGFVFLFVLFVFVVVILGKDDEVHGMNLRHFQLGVTFTAADNFAFFDFVFVQVDVRVTFRALGHGNLSFQS